MKIITINAVPGFDEWRSHARDCLNAHIPPDQILWNNEDILQNDLLGGLDLTSNPPPPQNYKIPKEFIEMAKIICCHRHSDRFALLYRMLWRLTHGERNLLQIVTDTDVITARAYSKAVRRDAYKITAFLRFREIEVNGEEYFIALYETEHYSLELKLDFFTKRFKNMRWSILTPYRAAHWDLNTLTLEDNPDPELYPKHDEVEKYWLTYYANIFNPARLKIKAMKTQMPQKYWKNMPETEIIRDMIANSKDRVQQMIDNQK